MRIRSAGSVPVFLAVLSLILGCGSEASGDDPDQTPAIETDSTGEIVVEDVILQWSAEVPGIQITVSAPTTGWIAVGFEPSAAMMDADIIMGYVSDGEVYIRDDWGDGYTSHKSDEELGGTDDITVVSGSEESGITVISFNRPLSADDTYDRELVIGNTYTILIAYGPDDADNFQGYHAWEETVEIEL